jgi:hypothetical protein
MGIAIVLDAQSAPPPRFALSDAMIARADEVIK